MLENEHLVAGDVVSYYARATDNNAVGGRADGNDGHLLPSGASVRPGLPPAAGRWRRRWWRRRPAGQSRPDVRAAAAGDRGVVQHRARQRVARQEVARREPRHAPPLPAETARGGRAARQAVGGPRDRGERFGMAEDRDDPPECGGSDGQRREAAGEGDASRRASVRAARAGAVAACRGRVQRHPGVDGRRGRWRRRGWRIEGAGSRRHLRAARRTRCGTSTRPCSAARQSRSRLPRRRWTRHSTS